MGISLFSCFVASFKFDGRENCHMGTRRVDKMKSLSTGPKGSMVDSIILPSITLG